MGVLLGHAMHGQKAKFVLSHPTGTRQAASVRMAPQHAKSANERGAGTLYLGPAAFATPCRPCVTVLDTCSASFRVYYDNNLPRTKLLPSHSLYQSSFLRATLGHKPRALPTGTTWRALSSSSHWLAITPRLYFFTRMVLVRRNRRVFG